MEKYIGVKLIKAEPMNRGDYNTYQNWTTPEDENPEDNGFLVEYLDGGQANHPSHEGYISWSPDGAFEQAYRKTSGLPFGLALEAMKKGKRVCLPEWSNDVMIAAQFPDADSKMTAPYLYVESRFGKVPWKETMIELFSESWIIVD